jgi:RHS repeat-associated protein
METTDANYTFSGKEKQTIRDLGWLDFSARMYANCEMPIFTTQDPLAEKYYSISPYAYCANNPLKFIDTDGRKIKLADNYTGAMTNIAQIAATNLGNQVLSHLINRNETYTLNSTFLSKSSSYDSRDREINYVANPWYSEIPGDGGALNSMTAMGHETFHAFDHSNNVFNENNAAYSTNIVEPRAVSFGNYLRQSYSLSPLREQYGSIKGNFHQFSGSEKISNFTTLGNNSDKTSYGFSYTKTTTTAVSYIGNTKIPKETKTTIATYYMTVSMDKNNNVTYQIYNNEEEYKKSISNW